VDDAGFMRGLDGAGQGLHQAGGLRRRQYGPGQLPPQAAPLHPFQGKEGLAAGLAHLVDGDNVDMAQAGDGLGLGLEAGHFHPVGVHAGADHLEGDEALEADLPGLVDDAHAAAAQPTEDLVARHERQGGPLRRQGAFCGGGVHRVVTVPRRRCSRGNEPGALLEEAIDPGQPLKAQAEGLQQFGAVAAQFLGGRPATVRLGLLPAVEEYLQPFLFGHGDFPRQGAESPRSTHHAALRGRRQAELRSSLGNDGPATLR
jgi:hypothetical protein